MTNTTVWHSPVWTKNELIAAKKDASVSVVLPALNEEETVASVIETIVPLRDEGLVDEIILQDSGSTDRTCALAASAGATVFTREQSLPGLTPQPGKGEVLWRSLAVAQGDYIAFIDSDLIDPCPNFVLNLLGPLLTEPHIELVKGFYRRPYRSEGQIAPTTAHPKHHGGGRVTELVTRPLLAALCPDLRSIIQPLGGEYAGKRSLLRSLPFAPAYGVEIGLLIDTYKKRGLSAIGQVNLGIRTHRNRPIHELGAMSRQVVATLLDRCGVTDSGADLTQFFIEGESFIEHQISLELSERPAMDEYLAAADLT